MSNILNSQFFMSLDFRTSLAALDCDDYRTNEFLAIIVFTAVHNIISRKSKFPNSNFAASPEEDYSFNRTNIICDQLVKEPERE